MESKRNSRKDLFILRKIKLLHELIMVLNDNGTLTVALKNNDTNELRYKTLHHQCQTSLNKLKVLLRVSVIQSQLNGPNLHRFLFLKS